MIKTRWIGIAISVLTTATFLHATNVAAQTDPLYPCCQVQVNSNGGTIMACPQGDGFTLADRGATVQITVLDPITGQPVQGVPADEFWLIDCDPLHTLTLAGGSLSSNADAATDQNGFTSISGAIAAGGYVDGLALVVQGCVVKDDDEFTIGRECADDLVGSCEIVECLPINVRSVDITGDLKVTAADLSQFALAYPPNPYQSYADFNGNGQVDLGDFSALVYHMGHERTGEKVYTISGTCQNVYADAGVENLDVSLGETPLTTTTDSQGRFIFKDVTLSDPSNTTIEITSDSAATDPDDPELGPYHTITQTFDVTEFVEEDFYMIPVEANLTATCEVFPNLLNMFRNYYNGGVFSQQPCELRPWQKFPIDVWVKADPDLDPALVEGTQLAIDVFNDAIRDEFGTDVFNLRVGPLTDCGIEVRRCGMGGIAFTYLMARDLLDHPTKVLTVFTTSSDDPDQIRKNILHELGHGLLWADASSGCDLIMNVYNCPARQNGYIPDDEVRLFLLMYKYLPEGLDLTIYDESYDECGEVDLPGHVQCGL